MPKNTPYSCNQIDDYYACRQYRINKLAVISQWAHEVRASTSAEQLTVEDYHVRSLKGAGVKEATSEFHRMPTQALYPPPRAPGPQSPSNVLSFEQAQAQGLHRSQISPEYYSHTTYGFDPALDRPKRAYIPDDGETDFRPLKSMLPKGESRSHPNQPYEPQDNHPLRHRPGELSTFENSSVAKVRKSVSSAEVRSTYRRLNLSIQTHDLNPLSQTVAISQSPDKTAMHVRGAMEVIKHPVMDDNLQPSISRKRNGWSRRQ